MPGWHARTKQLVADGQLLVAGLAPEQHGDRMALFLQWKQMDDMPVMVDSFNILGLKAVPITLLIDESGIIRHRNPSPEDLEAFLARPRAEVGSAPTAPRLEKGLLGIKPTANPPWTMDLKKLTELLDKPEGPDWLRADYNFQIGVAYRKRYDSHQGQPSDFASAVEHWTTALKLDPSNYIWRRRLQQYGPILDKPYPFYNWIPHARKEIDTRGAPPHALAVEPGDSELASPSNRAPVATAPPPHPDPDHQLPIAPHGLFQLLPTIIPHTGKVDTSFRVFLDAQPSRNHLAKWNDEAGLSSLHIKAPKGWTVHPAALTLIPKTGATDPLTATRQVEFEVRRDTTIDAGPFPPIISVEAYYQVCSGTDKSCQFLRSEREFLLRELR